MRSTRRGHEPLRNGGHVPSRALHIAVDGRELMGRPTGVGRYLLAVLRTWRDDATFGHQLTLVLPADPPPDVVALAPRIQVHVEPARNAGTLWEQRRLPKAVRAVGADVLFAAGYTAPLWAGVPTVVAIYDVSFFAHPEGFGPREGLRRRWFTRRAARRARTIITISTF